MSSFYPYFAVTQCKSSEQMQKIFTVPNFKPGEPDFVFYCPACRCNHNVFVNSGLCRWTFNGDMEAPTITPSLAIRRDEDSLCHFFIKAGRIEYLAGCTHDMAGQTVDMESKLMMSDYEDKGITAEATFAEDKTIRNIKLRMEGTFNWSPAQ